MDTPHPNRYQDDEIDVIQLAINLWKEKVIIITSLIICCLLAFTYLAVKQPIYTASMQLTPPTPAMLESFKPNIIKPNTENTRMAPETAMQLEILKTILTTVNSEKTTSPHAGEEFTLFINTLNSDKHVDEFRAFRLSENPMTNYTNRKVNIPSGRKANTKDYRISANSTNREQLADILKQDIAYATQATHAILNEYYTIKITKMIEQAQILGDIANARHLQKELENLQTKENTLSFSSGVVKSSTTPITPRNKLVIVLGILAGGMLGLCIALGKITYNNYNARVLKPSE